MITVYDAGLYIMIGQRSSVSLCFLTAKRIQVVYQVDDMMKHFFFQIMLEKCVIKNSLYFSYCMCDLYTLYSNSFIKINDVEPKKVFLCIQDLHL